MRIKYAIMTLLLGLALGPVAAHAQDPQNPPKSTDGYTIDMITELGSRFLGTDGNVNTYRSDLNYGKGFRLFDYNLLMKHEGDSGGLFDTLRVNAHGWGGDPSAYTRVEMEKTKWYRFDMNFRRFEYFNNLTTIDNGLHAADLARRFGDFNLTLLPQNDKIRFNIGYTSDYESGPSFSTNKYSNLIAGSSLASDEFHVSTPVSDHSNDFRFGADARLLGFDLSFMQGLRYYSQDTANIISTPTLGNNDKTVVNTFSRNMPVRGHLPYTRFSMHRMISDKVDLTGRFIYSAANTNYTVNELTTGKDKSGNNILQDSFTGFGATRRLSAEGDMGISYFATDKLTLSETFRVSTFHISGGDSLSNLVQRTTSTNKPLADIFAIGSDLNFTSYRQYLNQVEADYKINKKYSVHGGYRYTNRNIDLNDSHLTQLPPAATVSTPGSDTFNNSTHAGFFGAKAQPFSAWTIYGDVETGTADNVFVRVDNYNYTNYRVRNTIRPTKTLSINASFVSKDNSNPTINPLATVQQTFGVETRSRAFSGSVDWDPNPRFSVSTGYTYNRVRTNAAIQLAVLGLTGLQNGNSLYFVNDNFFYADARIKLQERATVHVGYRIDNDSGQGNQISTVPTQLISSYPINYQSPEARLTIKISKNIDWNGGYQFYNYKETLTPTQNYRAHTAYSSLTIRFNRE